MRKPSLADRVHRLSGKAQPLNFTWSALTGRHTDRTASGSKAVRERASGASRGSNPLPFQTTACGTPVWASIEGCVAPWLSMVSFDKGERKERMDYKKVAAYASAQTRSAIESATQIKENFKNLMVNVQVYGDSLSVETNIDFMSPEEAEE